MYSIIPCKEKFGSVDENFSILEAPEAKVTLQCDFADRYVLVADLLLNRRPWPYYSGLFMPLATNCSIVNLDTTYTTYASAPVIYYAGYSEVTVIYTSKFQDLYSEELEPYTEFQKVPNKSFRWQSGGLLSDEQEVGFLRRGVTLSKTYYDVLDPVSQDFIDYVGFVNSDYVVNSMGFTFAPETLLFTPPHMSRTVRFDSTNAWQLNVKFMYKKPYPSDDPFPGWNTFWNPDTQLHERMVVLPNTFGSGALGGNYIQYPSAPFNGVFF